MNLLDFTNKFEVKMLDVNTKKGKVPNCETSLNGMFKKSSENYTGAT